MNQETTFDNVNDSDTVNPEDRVEGTPVKEEKGSRVKEISGIVLSTTGSALAVVGGIGAATYVFAAIQGLLGFGIITTILCTILVGILLMVLGCYVATGSFNPLAV